MTFQYTPEQFSNAAPSRQQECARPSTDAATMPERAVPATSEPQALPTETIMVQTPNGAAMLVRVGRRSDTTHPVRQIEEPAVTRAPIHVLTHIAKSVQQNGGMPLPHSTSCRVRVAAAPER